MKQKFAQVSCTLKHSVIQNHGHILLPVCIRDIHMSILLLNACKCSDQGPFTHAIFDAISRTKRALPYPARMLFSRSIAWIGKKVITYYLKTPFFPISASMAVFCRSVARPKPENSEFAYQHNGRTCIIRSRYVPIRIKKAASNSLSTRHQRRNEAKWIGGRQVGWGRFCTGNRMENCMCKRAFISSVWVIQLGKYGLVNVYWIRTWSACRAWSQMCSWLRSPVNASSGLNAVPRPSCSWPSTR